MIGPQGTVVGSAHGPLPLFTQSSGCAEVFAATIAIRLAYPPIEIITDYEQLVDGWHQGLGAFTHSGAKGGEAWKWFWKAAEDFGIANVSIRKVPAHFPLLAVSQGRITFADWLGNRKADEMAKKGVDEHPSNLKAVQEEQMRICKQELIGKYLAWVNVRLQENDVFRAWHADITSDMVDVTQATRGLSRVLGAASRTKRQQEPVA